MVAVGDCSGGKSCSNSIFIGESANVSCFSSRSSDSEVFVGIEAGEAVCKDSAMVVAVLLAVDDGGGEGG